MDGDDKDNKDNEIRDLVFLTPHPCLPHSKFTPSPIYKHFLLSPQPNFSLIVWAGPSQQGFWPGGLRMWVGGMELEWLI